MGASITILGINEEINEKNQLDRLVKKYYESFNDGKAESIGLDMIFEVMVKKHCFEISEMLEYYHLGFNWGGSNMSETYEGCFILPEKLMLDLLDWFIALSYVFNSEEVNLLDPVMYVEKALNIKNIYKSEYDFFSFSYFTLIDLKKKIQSDPYQSYLWINSI